MEKLQSFIKQIPVIPVETKISELSRTLLDKIIFQIGEGKKAWKRDKTYKEVVLDKGENPKGDGYNSIVPEIRQEIEMFSKIGKRYSFIIGGRPIIIYAIYPYSHRVSHKKIYDMLDKSVTKMYLWLYTAIQFAPVECSRELVIYWYLTNHKKLLPKKKNLVGAAEITIDQIHANTAFTQACPLRSNTIYIFRKEEWFKVFIHETFHSFGMDFATMPETYAEKAMFSVFPVRCDLRFYEMYTEIWAEIMNVIFLSLDLCDKNQKGCRSKIYGEIEDRLEDERKFSLFQKTKILRHQKLKYRELCVPSHYQERTNVFSYYILKSISMFFYNDFIEWCVKHNKGTIVFKKIPGNIISLVDWIRSKHKDPSYIKVTDEMDKWFSKNSHKGDEMDTLRMSINE